MYFYSIMMLKAVETILNVLSIIRPEYKELQLINQLNHYFNFDHNIFLVSPSTDFNYYINTAIRREYAPQSIHVFKNVDGNITGMETINQHFSKNKFLIFVPAISNFESNLDALTQLKKIQLLQNNMKIGIFFNNITSSMDLQRLFEWCWKHKIINIFAVTYSYPGINQKPNREHLLNIFTFRPFGEFEVINVTGSESFENLFLSQHANFQQHPFRLVEPDPIQLDDTTVWHTVCRVLNASYTLVHSDFLSIGRSELFDNDTFDTTAYMYADNERSSRPKRVNLYTIKSGYLYIVVPAAVPYPEFAAYLRALSSNEFCVCSILGIVAIVVVLVIFRYLNQKTILFFQCAADVLNLLMNDNGSIKYQQLSQTELFLVVPLTFIGFVITNGIISNLQSFLARPILQPQINTVEDMYRSPYPILTHKISFARALIGILNNTSQHTDWNDKVHSIDLSLLKQQMQTFNTSIMFMEADAHAENLLTVQNRLNIRGYYLSNFYVFKYLQSYPISDDFPFTERLNEIIHLLHSSGLYNLWHKENRYGYMKLILQNMIDDVRVIKSTEIEPFSMPTFIAYGWIIGIMVLFGEIIWKNKLSLMVGRKYRFL